MTTTWPGARSSDVLEQHDQVRPRQYLGSQSSVCPIYSRRLAPPVEIERRIDDAHMAESLGKIAQHALQTRVILFRQQPDVIAQPDQVSKKSFRFSIATLQNVNVGQPERAC